MLEGSDLLDLGICVHLYLAFIYGLDVLWLGFCWQICRSKLLDLTYILVNYNLHM